MQRTHTLTRAFSLLLLGLVLALAPSSLRAETEVEGQGPGGAYYKIVVPDVWNEDLVIWNHGFSMSPIGPVNDLGPLKELQLIDGYAVAASSYRMPGWALFKSNRDLEEMLDAFIAQFGPPGRVILYGASLGGLVTAAALEKADLGNVVGALSFCGALSGSRIWDGGLDLRLLYDVVCANVPNAQIPGGAKGLPKNSDFTDEDLESAVNACTGILKPKAKRSRKQKKNLKRILDLTGLPASFLMTDMGFVTFAMSDLVHDRAKLRGRIGTGNRNVVYGDPQIDAEIDRVKAKRRPDKKLHKNFTPLGQVGGAKIVALHTDKDGLVIVENLREYMDVVPPANLTAAVVREKRPSHCVFTPPEIFAGWQDLLDWLDGDPQPTVQTLQNTCESVAPIFGDFACRFDPDFDIPDMDGRVRPR